MWSARPNSLLLRRELLENSDYSPKQQGCDNDCTADRQREQSIQWINVEERFAAIFRLLRLLRRVGGLPGVNRTKAFFFRDRALASIT